MKKYTILFISFTIMMGLSSAVSEEVLVTNFSIKKDVQLPQARSYDLPEWRNARKFAIYGQFKISNWMHSEIPILSLNFDQTNIGSLHNTQHKITVQDNAFIFYSYHQQNYDPSQYIGRLTFDNKDFGEWIFVYQGFDMDQDIMVTYIKSANKEMKILTRKSLSHVDADKAQLVLGSQSVLSDSDQIDMKTVTIRYGEGAYQESNFDELMIDPCSHLYEECGFKGEASTLCQPYPSSSNRFFKSIYVAPGAGFIQIAPPVSRYSKPFNLRFLKSVECVDHEKYFEYAAQGILEIISLPDSYYP